MRTTLDLDEDLLMRAMSVTKSPTKTAVIEQGLRELIGRAARERLASLYGSMPLPNLFGAVGAVGILAGLVMFALTPSIKRLMGEVN